MDTRTSPRVLGVFASRKDLAMGYAGTARAAQSITYWLGVRYREGEYRLHALNAERLPTPVKTTATREEFLAGYAPEPALYVGQVLPALRARLEALGLGPAPGAEAVAARQKELEALGLWCGDAALCAELLANLGQDLARNPQEAAVAQAAAISGMAVDLRKMRRLDEALDSLRKALEMRPEDDHLHFNLARAFFEKQDYGAALASANRALEINPGLDYARKLAAHIARRAAPGSGA